VFGVKKPKATIKAIQAQNYAPRRIFGDLHHGGRLLSPYTLSPIIFTMNKIYIKPMIWTFRACLGDQTISKKPINILFSRRDMHFQFTTGLLAKFGHGC
jgi:hypothetical protein